MADPSLSMKILAMVQKETGGPQSDSRARLLPSRCTSLHGRPATHQCVLMNPRTACPVCEEVRIAQSFISRCIGLLGRRELRHGHGLWLRPSSGIHTMFMRFPIDVVAFDRHGTVVKTIQNLRPWRIACVPLNTQSVLELPAGHLLRNPITIGEQAWPVYA